MTIKILKTKGLLLLLLLLFHLRVNHISILYFIDDFFKLNQRIFINFKSN